MSQRLFLFPLKPFVAPGGWKYVEYFALGLTLKRSLGINPATGQE